jgi:hypothetical protein
VSVTVPVARATNTGLLSVEIVAREALSTVHAASVRGWPCSSTTVNCWLPPTARLAFAGVIWSEFGVGQRALSVTCIFVSATFPAKSTVRTTIRLTPGFSEMLQEKIAPASVIGTPLQVSEKIPDKRSATVPEAVMPAAVNTAPSVGVATVSAGGVLSMLMVALAVAVTPAASVTVPLTT